MSAYDLIAFDMDGTLLDSAKQITSRTLDMISIAESRGKIVCLGTGRCIPELQEYIPQIPGLRYIIGESGVFVRDLLTDTDIFSSPLPVETAIELLRRVQETGIDVMPHIHCDRSIVQLDHVPRMAEFNMAVYQPLYERICTMVEDIYSFFLSAPFAPNKINLYCKTIRQRDFLEDLLSDLNVKFKHVEGLSLECMPVNASKGDGLKRLCTHLSIPVERSIAVGDADNDLEMLSAAGLAIAMGNANDHVKALADVIVADNDHDGCAEAICNYLL